MSKWYGMIGFGKTVETAPSVWTEEINEYPYYGDVLRNSRRLQTTDKVNDDIEISNQISIVADPYACNNFHAIRYVIFMGTKWKVTEVEVAYPRLILSLGGVYNAHSSRS